MKRRHWLLGGAASAAVAAGVGWQRWFEGRLAPAPAEAEAAAESSAGGLWQMSFEQPDGGRLLMSTLRGQPLLLNFWGSWCPPCVKEMPELDRFARQFGAQGWKVVGLAVDNAVAVREFLARAPVGYAIGLAGFDGLALTRALGNDQAGLPFTVAFNRQGALFRRKAGATSFDELAAWARLL